MTAQRPPFPEDDFWTHDHQLGEGVFYSHAHTIRLKLHRATDQANYLVTRAGSRL